MKTISKRLVEVEVELGEAEELKKTWKVTLDSYCGRFDDRLEKLHLYKCNLNVRN